MTNFDFPAFVEIWEEFLTFLDQVMGWLNFVLGNADSPRPDYPDYPH